MSHTKCGVRTGGKPPVQEVEEARDSLNRWLVARDAGRKQTNGDYP